MKRPDRRPVSGLLLLAALSWAAPAAAAQDELRILSKTPVGPTAGIGQAIEITVTFSQPMVPLQALPAGGGSGPLTIAPPVRGTYRWKGPSTLVFTPRDTLVYATAYRVRVPAGTTALSGVRLAKDASWSFETPRPQLTYSDPSHEATQVNLKQVIYLHFNQPMDPAKARPFVTVSAVGGSGKPVPLAMVLARPSAEERKRRGLGANVLTLAATKPTTAEAGFTAADFAEHFWRQLRNPVDSVSCFLASRFSDGTRRLLGEYDLRMPAGQPLKDAVVGEINRIIASQPIYAEARFARVKLTQGIRSLAGQQLSKDNRSRLNRLLLRAAYDEYLDRVAAMPQERTIRIELAKGLPAAAGTLGLAAPQAIVFSTYSYFRFAGADQDPDHDPSSPVVLRFSTPVYAADLLKALTVSPTAARYGQQDGGDGGDEYEDRSPTTTPSLRFQFRPETEYRFTVSGTLRDMFGQVLAKDGSFTVKTAAYASAVQVPAGLGVLEAYLPARLPVRAMNWGHVQRRFANVPTDDIVPLLHDGIHEDHPVAGWPGAVSDEWDLKTNRNVLKRLPLELGPVLSPENTGLVYYNLYGLPPREYTYERWVDTTRLRSVAGFVQVTGIGLTGKYSPDNVLIWATRLKDCAPVTGAAVQLRNDANAVLFNGVTDKNGLCVCPGWQALGIQQSSESDEEYYYGNRPRVWAIVSKGGDRAVLVSRWGMGIEPYEFGLPYDWNPQPVQYQGFLFTERGLYKAGEKVFIKGIFRQKRRGQWELPARRTMTLVIRDARDQELVNKAVALSEWGSFAYTLQLKAGAPSGYYSIAVRSDSIGRMQASESFRVEAYKPAKFEVAVATARPEYVAGDSLAATVTARYLFGAPMTREKFTWAARLAPYEFTPPGREGFCFNRSWWWDEGRDYGSLLASGEGQLDAQGSAGVGALLDLRGSAGTMALTVEATATAADRTSMSGRRQAVVHRGEYYLGYQQNTSFIDVGKPLTLSVIGAHPDGSLAPGQTVTAEVIRQQWISARRAGPGGRYEWYSERQDSTVSAASVVTGQAPATIAYTPDRSGFYLFRLTATDRRGNVIVNSGYFYAIGGGRVSWQARNDDRIDLVADKERYRPGEKARIMVKSPYPSCKALVTVEREFILSQRVLDLSGNAPVIELPVLAEHLPNVYVSVVLLRGRLEQQSYGDDGEDLSKPAFKIGYVNLAVDPGSQRLSLQVASDKPSYQPRDSVTLTFTACDVQNKPAAAEVTLAVVDKGVLNLIDFRTPDAFDAFYGARPLSVETAETRIHVIGQRNYGEKGENRGGGGGPDAGFRGDFQTTPFYRSALYTDKDGRAQARFRLPDNLTSFKIMATAHTKSSQFGAGENTFTVSKRIMLLEALPRFLRAGDSLAAGVTVHNRTGRDQQVEVKAAVSGAELVGPSAKTVDVKPDQPVEVTFGYRARAVGLATFRFSATAEGGADGLELALPVLMPKITETVALYEQTDGAASQALVVPADVWPDVGSLQLTASSTAFAGLEGCLDYLIKYPYGCLEQTLSGLMPMILAHDLIEKFGLAPQRGTELRTHVQTGIERLYKFQGPDGGFGLWQDSRYRDPYLTAYVLWGLHRAKAKGYEIDQGVVDNAVSFLRSPLGQIGQVDRVRWPYSRRWKYNTMAYASYALALWGKQDQPALAALAARRDSMNLFGRTMLLRALSRAKYKPDLREALAQQLFNAVKVAPTTWHFEDAGDESDCWVFYSNVVSTAQILSTLLEVKGEFAGAEQVVKWLMEERKVGRWRSTHENMAVFTAMDDYLNIYEKDEPDFTAEVAIAGREVLREAFKGRELSARTTSHPLSDYAPGKRLPVEVSKEGPGRLYYGLRMTYAPRAPVKYRDEGFAVSKRITTATGDTLATQFAAGKVYRVTLTVTTTQDRHFVVVDDPLPAGFEPVNLGFATESDGLRGGPFEDGDGDGGREWGWWWGGFNHTETYDDRVLCFADLLSNGTHTHSYLMRALLPGRFALPQTKAEEMYNPEVFGWIPDTVIEVK